jgi:hypothetical protein
MALHSRERSSSRPDHSPPPAYTADTPWIGSRVGPAARMNVIKDAKHVFRTKLLASQAIT